MSGILGRLRRQKEAEQKVVPLQAQKEARSDEKKMCDVLVEFAEPLTEMTRHEDDFRTAISIAVLSWNLSLLPKQKQTSEAEKMWAQLTQDGTPVPSELKTWVQLFLIRKQVLFPNDKRLILHYEVTGTGRDGHVTVMFDRAPN